MRSITSINFVFSTFLSLSFMICQPSLGLAKARSDLAESKSRKLKTRLSSTKNKKLRRLYLNFSGATLDNTQNDQHNDNQRENKLMNVSSRSSVISEQRASEKIGFNSDISLGYSNSAYRYAGEDYPAKSLDFGMAPSLESSCFGTRCVYFAKIGGGVDLNTDKSEISLFQFGLKLPGDPWGGRLRPTLAGFAFVPTTQKEIQVDRAQYSLGGSFSLSSTPALMGGEFLGLTAAVSFRKNVHEQQLATLQNWASRQAFIADLNFSKTLSASFVFGHIVGFSYDGSNKEVIELGQSISWQASDWLNFSLGHNNTGPLFSTAGNRIDTSLVSIDNSVVSASIGISNSF